MTSDAFGDALLDHQSGGSGWYAIERSDGFLEVERSMSRYFEGLDAFLDLEVEAINHFSGKVLDIGSGAGRFALAAQAIGCDVTALDNSPGAVEVCRRRGLSSVVESSIHSFDTTEMFDTLVMLGHNLALLGPDPVSSLRHLRSMAAPGARIIGTSLDPYQTDDPGHLAYHESNRARGRYAGHLVLRIRRRHVLGPWFDYLFLSVDELTEACERAGWGLTVVGVEGPHYLVRLNVS